MKRRLRTLLDLALPDVLPFEQGISAGLRTYGARLILFALSTSILLVLLASVAVLLHAIERFG